MCCNCSECLGEHLTISNSAAGVLAHLVAEPLDNWTVDVPSHSDVREGLRETINGWDLNEKRNVRYRYHVMCIALFLNKYDMIHPCSCRATLATRVSN